MQKKIFIILVPAFLFQSCILFNKSGEKDIEANKKSEKLWGIDLSHYQEIEDWKKIKTHEPSFIFLKATEGSTHRDPKYAEYYEEIKKHSIPVGSYHFFTYTSSGKNQAKNFLSVLKYKKGDLPIVLDAEFAKKMPEKQVIEKEILAFINTVVEETRCHPIVYCDYKYYLLYLKKILPEKCKLWIVNYRGEPDCDWTFWQTTDKYTVAGIKGRVDFNLFNGSAKDLKKMIN